MRNFYWILFKMKYKRIQHLYIKNTLEIEKFTKQLLDISNMEQSVGGVKQL